MKKKKGVSEMFAALLMMGITLAFGSYITLAAINQFNLAAYSSSLALSVEQASAGKLVTFVYSSVNPGSGGCTVVYGGVTEGKSFTLALYNYGNVGYNPIQIVLNGTQIYSGSGYGNVAPGAETVYSFTLSSCVHPTGQSFVLVDAPGDEVLIST